MRKIFLILSYIILTNMIGFGQKCNFETISNLRVHKDSLTNDLITDFLISIDKTCSNNVEWSEASNWTLFWLADIETEKFINLLKINQGKIDTELIIYEFQQPINDGIDLVGIHKKIVELNDESELVIKILNSIKTAAKGLEIEIK